MKIYTKSGDDGATSLFGGPRVRKDHERIHAYGTVDELNAAIGVCRAECRRVPNPADTVLLNGMGDLLGEVQHRLFDLGAELACPAPEAGKTALLNATHVQQLEAAIDRYESHLPPLREFVLPGGSAPAAGLHSARCVCRRAERWIVTLGETQPVRDVPLHYVNRLSDLLFVLARAANAACGEGRRGLGQKRHAGRVNPPSATARRRGSVGFARCDRMSKVWWARVPPPDPPPQRVWGVRRSSLAPRHEEDRSDRPPLQARRR